jgi:C_GCAxxG_C_C family probable redox protein
MKRRKFIFRLAAFSLGPFTLGACLKGDSNKRGRQGDAAAEEEGTAGLLKNREMPSDLVMKLLDQKVDRYMQLSNNCAQSSFLALSEQFELEGAGVLKALTPLPGIAERGETCGAVIGPLMAMGLLYGRGKNQLHDWEAYRESLVPSGKFCANFEKTFGSTLCRDIQADQFGRSFDLNQPEELREFQAAGATAKCSEVARKSVRMAAEIILNDLNLPDEA